MEQIETQVEEVYAPYNENEIIILRKQSCLFTLTQDVFDFTLSSVSSNEITREKYIEQLKEKNLNIGYERKTLLVFYKVDRPGILFVKTFNTNASQYICLKGLYVKKKVSYSETISFNLKTNNVKFRVYEKMGKKSNIRFKNFNDNSARFNEMISKLFEGSEFFDVVCKELNLDISVLEKYSNKLCLGNKLKSVVLFFLLNKRGFNIDSLDCYDGLNNFKVNSLSWCLKNIEDGYNIEDVVKSFYSIDDIKQIEALLTDNCFESINVKSYANRVKMILQLFDLTPIDLIDAKLNCNLIKQYLPRLTLLKKIGYSFYELKDFIHQTKIPFNDFMDLLLFLNRLNLQSNMDLAHVHKYAGEFKLLVGNIKEYMLTESIFYPLNLKVSNKLTNKNLVFKPLYSYMDLDFYNCNNSILYQPYTVYHRKLGPIGIMLLCEGLEPVMLNRNYGRSYSEELTIVKQHVLHKIRKTKLLQCIDFKILVNKITLKKFLDNKLGERYTNLIKW